LNLYLVEDLHFGNVDVAEHHSPLAVTFEPSLVAVGNVQLRNLKLRKCNCCFELKNCRQEKL